MDSIESIRCFFNTEYMIIPFYKYQGTGNDFVMIDNRNGFFDKNQNDLVAKLCDRKFGIGADGLILLQNHKDYDFEMVYYNSDGRESSMCGNGGRCVSIFAVHLGIVKDRCQFIAIDGEHEAIIKADDWVELKMGDVKNVIVGEDHFVMDTGSPHYVIFVEDIDDINVVENGQAIRYSKEFREKGINVNFVEAKSGRLIVATYERGVEDETLSCGTGVTASAIAHTLRSTKNKSTEVPIESKGGKLIVRLEQNNDGTFENIWLCGKAERVFRGEITIG